MANISQFIQKIRSAIYGEEVRGSICDALTAMNTETESYVEQAAAQVELATQQAENSSASATASADSATSSANSAITSESWAVGGTGTREGEDTNNAKYWCDQAREASGDVTGVKGNEETEYRTGDVNLTCENIGAATASDMEQAQTDINQLNQSLDGVSDLVGGNKIRTYYNATITTDENAYINLSSNLSEIANAKSVWACDNDFRIIFVFKTQFGWIASVRNNELQKLPNTLVNFNLFWIE